MYSLFYTKIVWIQNIRNLSITRFSLSLIDFIVVDLTRLIENLD